MQGDFRMLKDSLSSFDTGGRFKYYDEEPTSCDCPAPCVQDLDQLQLFVDLC